MNDILQLKGTLQDRSNDIKPGARNVPKNAPAITSQMLRSLQQQLQSLDKYWEEQKIIEGCLVDVCYVNVVAKSNRISGFLTASGTPNNSIVGARFAEGAKRKHIITHYIGNEIIKTTIGRLRGSMELLAGEFDGAITYELIDRLGERDIRYEDYGITKTAFRNLIVDTHYIEGFKVQITT